MAAVRLVLFAILVAGCGVTEPYEFRPGEFDRDNPEFRKEPEVLTEVAFCYSGLATSQLTIDAEAEARCNSRGRTAQFRDFSYVSCPLMTPVLATYDCVMPPPQ